MHRRTHQRGFSQQISRCQPKNKDKDVYEINYCHAFSSEHTRSTAVTNKPNKTKHKKSLSNRHTKNRQQKQLQGNMGQLRTENGPYTPKQILNYFPYMLEPQERQQIREYQNIYYIGGNKQKQYHKIPFMLSENNSSLFYRYRIGDHIAYRYEIISMINRGSFGEVLKVYDHKNKELQALKIIKKVPELIKQTFVEISILTSIKQKDKEDLSGIVRIKDFTVFRDHICIFFELLQANLYELIYSNDFHGLEISFVRLFAIQILNALNFLYKSHIIHCDIKLENVVLKFWGKSGIKLIDFGTSCYEDQQSYTYIQSRYYRAPQIIFQHKYSCAIDMWSFGCMIPQLCFGKPLFPGTNNLHQLFYMCALLGFPDSQYSSTCRRQIQGIRMNGYLEKDKNGKFKEEKIKEFEQKTGLVIDRECLEPLEKRLGSQNILMIHFLTQILRWLPKDRITPYEALQHPWVLEGLPTQMKELYYMHETLQKNDKKDKIKTHKRKKSSKSKSHDSKRNSKIDTRKKVFLNLGLTNITKSKVISPYKSKEKSKEKVKEKSKIMKKSMQKKKDKGKGFI